MADRQMRNQIEMAKVALAQGESDELYWYISVDLPLRFGSMAKQISGGVKWLGGVPVIPIGDHIDSGVADAEMLLWLFECSHRGEGMKFKILLTDKESLDSICPGWYEWGDQMIDHICMQCGQVHRVGYSEPWQCCS